MTNANDVTNWYANFFKAWQVKLVGQKPTAEMLTAIHGLGAKPGKQALACAMTLRPEGVTASQIVIVCGAPQNNKRTGFITDGLLKRIPMPQTAEGHTVYKCEVTAKGQKRISTAHAKAVENEAKGKVTDVEPHAPKAKAKAKGTVKPKAGKAKPKAEKPTSDAPSVIEQVPAPVEPVSAVEPVETAQS